MATEIDVVILTWNDQELADEAIESVFSSGGASFRVFVVDNGSAVPFQPTRALELIRLDTNRGVAAGRNLGANSGSAPMICFLDSDARLRSDALAQLIPVMRRRDIALAVPVLAGQKPATSAGRAPTLGRKLARMLGLTAAYASVPTAGPAWDVDFGIGACQLVRRTAFEAVGGFDERYFYGPEDVDLCLRLRRAGWRVVQVGSAICDHPARRRFRRPWTRRGLSHGIAVLRHLWRHRAGERVS